MRYAGTHCPWDLSYRVERAVVEFPRTAECQAKVGQRWPCMDSHTRTSTHNHQRSNDALHMGCILVVTLDVPITVTVTVQLEQHSLGVGRHERAVIHLSRPNVRLNNSQPPKTNTCSFSNTYASTTTDRQAGGKKAGKPESQHVSKPGSQYARKPTRKQHQPGKQHQHFRRRAV